MTALTAPAQARPELRVSFVDVEGGQATLFVSQKGESLLVDTGWAGHDGRDADRIVAAAKKAGLNHIDAVLITHYHADHVGGVPQLLDRIPVTKMLDHGENRETENPGVKADYEAYLAAIEKHHVQRISLHTGDALPLKSIQAKVVISDGMMASYQRILALNADGTVNTDDVNQYCGKVEERPVDTTENAHSLGIQIQVGKVRVLDLGDLTNDKERALMCPYNDIGHFDLLVVSHHGSKISSTAALVHAIHPRIAVMDNGEKKGGDTVVLDTIRTAPGLEAFYQLHYSAVGGPSLNNPTAMIANPEGTEQGYGIEADIQRDGSIDITNERTGDTRHFAAKK